MWTSVGRRHPHERPHKRPHDGLAADRHAWGRSWGRSAATVAGMPNRWDLRLTIDAHGNDRCRVWVRDSGEGRGHIAIRMGPVVMYCVDGAAVTSMAAAWAVAHASSAHLLPFSSTNDARPQPGAGVAAPVSEIAVEGHQRWDVTAPHGDQRSTLVASDWLSIRVHDIPALETYTQAWAAACALGARVLRTAPVPFDRLLGNARDSELARRYHLDHGTGRGAARSR